MSETNFTPTKEYLHQIFEYKDGHLYWKINKQSICAGDKTGTLGSNGYFRTIIKKKSYLVHRLIFLFHYGHLPLTIDHIDGNPLNNNIDNLREATQSENICNAKLYKNSTSGIKNVYLHKAANKWAVRLSINQKRVFLGLFEDLELADLVAQEARALYHGKFARHG
jgi:hypothetical protein